ncbi:MAG: Asp-tRNA(Asn)/Glu-tRNA(Gln) amidotransferase subunit GatC [Micavibrio aeruginosavorus]|nr:Asp-tRNA(Asn)/Glu-tRNA(Gln) amidotransferase subunit GatC [Micavibrio aeruginosavorus]
MDKATVKKVATLARLAITEAEQEKFATQLGGILKWVEMMGEVNTDNVEPLANVVNIDLKLRPDIVNDGDIRDAVLANAPEALEGFFVVPKVVE